LSVNNPACYTFDPEEGGLGGDPGFAAYEIVDVSQSTSPCRHILTVRAIVITPPYLIQNIIALAAVVS
jgi:hypothetical protein